MPGAAPVFVSYRRRESSGLAGRPYDRLAAHFGADQVFMDIDTIALGVDFDEVITQAVSGRSRLRRPELSRIGVPGG